MNKTWMLLSMAGAIYAVFFWPFASWGVTVQSVAVLVIIQLLWIGRVFKLAHSSIILILLLSFHFYTYDETLDYFGSGLVWLLFSTFILAYAFIQTGLAARVSLYVLSLAKGSGKLLILVSFLLMFVLTVMIPSNIGKGSLVSSVLDDLSKSLKKVYEVNYLPKALFIGVAYVSAISGAFVPTGASSTIYAFGIFSEVSPSLTYMKWLLYFSVPMLSFVMLLWLVFIFWYPEEKIEPMHVKNLINRKMQEIGRLNPEEIRMMVIMLVTLGLWMSQPVHGYSIPLVGLLGASLVVFPGIGVLKWEEATKGVNWDMMIFFAATLMLANMLIDTGTVEVLVSFLVSHSNDWYSWVFAIGVLIITSLIRVVFVNVLGFMTIMLPTAITLGEKLDSITPLTLAMGVYLIGIPGFLLVTQSPVHLISYSYGYFTDRDLFLVGLIAMLIWIVIVCLTMLFYWSWII
ncbi:SLC13 family permease [Halobacillus andaensis]|uniref:SLC13 family permease n=1 Tax=Halobacillus andaensis TaxID=1176239 RepID=UPI003D75FEB0